jgi:DNA-binding XRE family transcriptional regulator
MKKKKLPIAEKPFMKYDYLANRDVEESFKKWLTIIGDNFRSLRINGNETIGTVARAVKVKNGTLYRVESGLHMWDAELIYRLCAYFKVRAKDVAIEGKFKLPRALKAKKPLNHELN